MEGKREPAKVLNCMVILLPSMKQKEKYATTKKEFFGGVCVSLCVYI